MQLSLERATVALGQPFQGSQNVGIHVSDM